MQSEAIEEPSPIGNSYCIRNHLERGRGCFATNAITTNARILTANAPLAHVIFRKYKKEVCVQCFKYNRGKTWPISYAYSTAASPRREVKIAWFCSSTCLVAWRLEHDDIVCQAMAELEIFSREYNPTPNQEGSLKENTCLSSRVAQPADIVDRWKLVEDSATRVREARSICQPGKQHRKLLQARKEELRKDIDLDLDVTSYFLRGILARYKSTGAWKSVYTLAPSVSTYITSPDGLRVLNSHCIAYLLLQLLLPQELLPFGAQETIRTLTSRDSTNAFGLWCESGDEYLGYGIWVEASFFNHSCDPNVRKNTVEQSWIFEAARNIEVDEELCISYLGLQEELMMPVAARRARLLLHWGFLCRCSKCITEAGENAA